MKLLMLLLSSLWFCCICSMRGYISDKGEQTELTEKRTAYKVKLSDIQYDLYTPDNPRYPQTIINNSISQLAMTYFDYKRLNIFVCHGWLNDRNSDVNTFIRRALFGDYNVNLLIVDWSKPGNRIYRLAKDAVVPVGRIIGEFINQMQSHYGLDGDNFVLIGHSLGAHVVGCAGAVIHSKVGNIIGMDPARVGFSLENIHDRLDATDGKYVQIIHTSSGILGIKNSIGHADFYPNGGTWQPGCGLSVACSHSKAYGYVAEAIERGPSVFRSVRCRNWNSFTNGRCKGNTASFMGALIPRGYFGKFFLRTKQDAPFGLS